MFESMLFNYSKNIFNVVLLSGQITEVHIISTYLNQHLSLFLKESITKYKSIQSYFTMQTNLQQFRLTENPLQNLTVTYKKFCSIRKFFTASEYNGFFIFLSHLNDIFNQNF